jgi:elongation factor P hydroxylase
MFGNFATYIHGINIYLATFMITLSVRCKSNDYGKDYEDQGRDHNRVFVFL